MKFARAWPWLVGVIFFLLYGFTAAPSIVELFDDSLEFQLVAPTFGIAHPTGYPLYIIIGGIWSRLLLPIGNWAWRMNLFSALAAAITVGLLFQLASRLASTPDRLPNPWAGLGAALAFGLEPIWWQQATVAEVYTLHGLFVVAILLAAIGITNYELRDEEQARFTDRRSLSRHMLLLCTLIGLALTHHRTSVLVLPGLLIYMLWSVPGLWRPRRDWWLWLAALALPLLFYLWLPLRASMGIRDLHGSYRNTWSGFWEHVLARGYTGFFANNSLTQPRSTLDWVTLWQQQVGALGLGLGILGLVLLRERQSAQKWPLSKAWFFLLLVLITNLLFALTYKVHDAEVFLLPALLIFALFVGGGIAVLGRLLGRWPRLAWMIQIVMLGLLALGVGGRGPWINRSQSWAVHDYAVALAKVDFPPGSRVIGLEGEATALHYMQQAVGLAQHATAVVADDPEQRRALVAQFVAEGNPTYLTRELANIGQRYSFSGDGPLVRVWPRGQAQAGTPQHPVDQTFADGKLRLVGYDLEKLNQAGDSALRVAFYWQPQSVLTQTIKLSLRLQDENGAPVIGPTGAEIKDDQFPLRLVANAPDWVAGETIRDVHYLAVPTPTQRKPTKLFVVFYVADTLVELGNWSVDVAW